MNKLKEIDSKYYQECNVVMLPSITKASYPAILKGIGGDLSTCLRSQKDIIQHLYITSNEVFTKDNFVLHHGIVMKATEKLVSVQGNITRLEWRKIIATTDTSLKLPQPSIQFINKFIEEYNKGNIISKILVEYEKWHPCRILCDCQGRSIYYTLKIDKNNTITIKSVKDNWNIDEHCIDMQYYMEYCQQNPYVTPMKWLNELKHY